MSAFARKQLEKYGWKEGEGLGRNKEGMNQYIRTSRHNRATHNRDEKGNTYAGIGHESTKGGGASNAEKATELESVFAEIKAQRRNREATSAAAKSSSSDDDDDEDDDENEELEKQRREKEKAKAKKKKLLLAQQQQEEEEEHEAPENSANSKEDKKKKQDKKDKVKTVVPPPPQPSSSDSSSSSDDDDVDVNKLTDAQLLARCGGVRLGRAGRHRLFDSKLKRIEENDQEHSKKEDPYASKKLKRNF